jgi:hypothetical protein
MVVKEFVTRFSFETDRRGISRFNNTIGNMNRKILGLGAALGVTFGGKKMLDAAKELDRAANQARRFGAPLSEANKFLGDLGATLDGFKSSIGAFDQATPLKAFTRFKQVTEGLPDMGVKFDEFFKTGLLLAKAGQTPVDEMFENLATAMETGSLDFLKGVPGIDARVRGSLEKIFQINAPGAFLNFLQRPGFVKGMFGVIRKEIPRLEKDTADVLASPSGGVDELTTKFEAAATKLGDSLLKILKPAIDSLNEMMDIINNTEGKEFPVLSKIAEMLGLIPKGASLAMDDIDRLKDHAKKLAIGMAAGIGLGMLVGIPPLMGAVLGLGGAALVTKLQTDYEASGAEPFNVMDSLREKFPGLENVFPKETAEMYLEDDYAIPEDTSGGGGTTNINIRVDGNDPLAEQAVRNVVKKTLDAAVMSAHREFINQETVRIP